MKSWHPLLLGGLAPLLLLGFLYGFLADRTAFALWALVAGTAWVAALRQGIAAGWSPARRAGSLALLAGAGLGAFAFLVDRHGEILDLGFRAVLPGLYHPLATHPATAGALAAALVAAGAALLIASRVAGRAPTFQETGR